MEAELDALGEELELEEQEELDKHLLEVGPAVGLPEVPTAEPAKPAPARVGLQSEKNVPFHLFFFLIPGQERGRGSRHGRAGCLGIITYPVSMVALLVATPA